MKELAAALKRVEKVLLRSPQTGLHADAPATARWNGGTQVTTTGDNGARFVTDLPTEVGGTGTAVTPGWLLRAGLAACVTTRIVMAAAVEGIELTGLEVIATSESDARGLLGMADTDGQRVSAGPRDLRLHVKIKAVGSVSEERLRSLVERSHGLSPVSCAVQEITPAELLIEVG